MVTWSERHALTDETNITRSIYVHDQHRVKQPIHWQDQ